MDDKAPEEIIDHPKEEQSLEIPKPTKKKAQKKPIQPEVQVGDKTADGFTVSAITVDGWCIISNRECAKAVELKDIEL